MSFKVGDKVKFKNYSTHSGWLEHKGEVGKIIRTLRFNHYNYMVHHQLKFPLFQ